MDKKQKRLEKKQDLIYLAILVTIALVIGVYLIATTVLIAKDGIYYIDFAKQLEIKPLQVLKDSSEYSPWLYTPGYSFLILIMHKFFSLFSGGSTLSIWIYSAQFATLLCKVLAFIVLYFLGKEFVSRKMCFWALLILALLPNPARFGSDALRDWPHLLFLATAFLLLLLAAKKGNPIIFMMVGIVTGLGYTIRPMCLQIIAYGMLWFMINLIKPININRKKLLLDAILLITGFLLIAAPYSKIRGEVLHPRLKIIIHKLIAPQSSNIRQERINQAKSHGLVSLKNKMYIAGLPTEQSGMGKVFPKLLSSVGENLCWFFFPALLLGLYYELKEKIKAQPTFFIIIFILMNIGMTIARYSISPDLSKRYVLPLIAFTIFFVPRGLNVIAMYIQDKFSGNNGYSPKKLYHTFLILLIIGLCICIPKLLTPIRIDKKGYMAAIDWVKENTAQDDFIIVPDLRIKFYTERDGMLKVGTPYPGKAKYIIRLYKNGDEKEVPAYAEKIWSTYLDRRKPKDVVAIYKRK